MTITATKIKQKSEPPCRPMSTRVAIDGKTLRDAIGRMKLAVNSKASLPVLHCILIKTGHNYIRLRATDLEMVLDVCLSAECKEGMSAAVDAKLLSSILRAVGSGEITLEIFEDHLVIVDEFRTIRIATTPAEDFPYVPCGDNPEKIYDVSWLPSMLPALLNVTSDDYSRLMLTGVYWTPESLVATDTHRLIRRDLDEPMLDWKPAIVPKDALRFLPRLLNIKPGDKLRVWQDGVTITFANSNAKFNCRLINGTYPNYDNALSKLGEVKWQWVADSSRLIATLKSVLPIAYGDLYRVKLETDEDGKNLIISASDSKIGEIEASMPLSRSTAYHGGYVEDCIYLNAKYLIEMLQLFPPQTEVKLSCSGKLNAFLITADGYPGRLGVQMPMQDKGAGGR